MIFLFLLLPLLRSTSCTTYKHSKHILSLSSPFKSLTILLKFSTQILGTFSFVNMSATCSLLEIQSILSMISSSLLLFKLAISILSILFFTPLTDFIPVSNDLQSVFTSIFISFSEPLISSHKCLMYSAHSNASTMLNVSAAKVELTILLATLDFHTIGLLSPFESLKHIKKTYLCFTPFDVPEGGVSINFNF